MFNWAPYYEDVSDTGSEVLAFLSAFSKFRKVTTSFVMSIFPSAWNSLAPTVRVLMKLDIWAFLENLLRKFKFH
jgi:hypothetical protein